MGLSQNGAIMKHFGAASFSIAKANRVHPRKGACAERMI